MNDFKEHIKQIALLIVEDVHNNFESYRASTTKELEPYNKVILAQ